jgi:biotin carboxyl carrier protein
MNRLYRAKVNANFEFELKEGDSDALDIVELGDRSYHIIENNRSLRAQVLESDLGQKTYTIQLGSNRYQVKLGDRVDRQIEAMGLSVAKGKQVNALNAPMPGLVLEINVAPGDTVCEGEQLLILSAMKMENSFLSPRDGQIKAVHISRDQAVDKGQLLIEFED